MKYLYFYIGPDGIVKPNDRLYPVDLLRSITGDQDGLFFRFAFEPEAKRLFVQDNSFRDKLRSGDNKAWEFYNHALDYLNKKAQARFLDQKWGDPQDSGLTKSLSHYPFLWKNLHEIFSEEYNLNPIDMKVYEYVSLPDKDERISLLKEGSTIGEDPINEPMIGLNRNHSSFKKNGDVSFELINKALLIFYLSKMPEILTAIGHPDIAEKVKNAPKPQIMFAIKHNDKTRIFNAKDEADEENIRTAIKDYDGPVVIFDMDHGCKKVCFKNRMTSDFSKPPMDGIYKDILSSCGKQLKVPKEDLFVSFDHGLGRPFISKLSRFKVAWDLLREANPQMKDIPVFIVPFRTENKVVRSSDDEDEKCKRFRATRGVNIEYPFLLISGGGTKGKQLRTVVDSCLEFCYGKSDNQFTTEDEFLGFVDKSKPNIKKDMKHLIDMGYSKKEILDFFAKDFDLFRRAQFRQIYDEVSGKSKKRFSVASMGLGLQINENYIQIQDTINQAEHSNDKKKKNDEAPPSRKHISPRSYEQLLQMKHDREMSAMKTTEQLLHESRI